MATIKKYDMTLMNYMNVFESVTQVRPKDCLSIGESVFFIADFVTVKLAVGKQGANVRKLGEVLNRQVRIVGWSDRPEGLIGNYLFPTRPLFVKRAGNEVEIRFKDAMHRRYLLDNQQARLKELLELVQNYWPEIKEIKVL